MTQGSTHSLQFCAVPQRGNCCWGCRDDAKMMQDNDALFVYFLYLSAFLPTLCHLALFYPEFVHHRIFGSSHHRICASSESLHQAHIKWCILWICASSHHRSAEPGIVPARSSIEEVKHLIVRFNPFTKYFSSSFALHELVISLAYLMRLLYALWINFPLKY